MHDAAPASQGAASIASLPAAILERVLLLALPVDVERVVPEPIGRLPLREMQTLALVAHDWHAIATRLHRRFNRRAVDVVAARRGFCVKRPDGERHVNRFIVDVDAEIVRLMIKDRTGDDQDAWRHDWHALFKLIPNVRRLDLSKVSIRSRHLPALLKAASTHCGRVEALILTHVDWFATDAGRFNLNRFMWGGDHAGENEDDDDGEEEGDDTDDDFDEFADDQEDHVRRILLELGNSRGKVRGSTGHELDLVFDALYAALEQWYAAGANGGLRQLAIVERRSVDRIQDNNAFLRAIARFCPRIEYLEGCSRDSTVRANWVCDLDIWEEFCRSCVSLRTFDWLAVPFSDLYLLPFAATTKPFLQSLSIGYVEHAQGFPIRDLRVSTAVLGSVFSALPALETLKFDCAAHASDTFVALSTLLGDDLTAAIAASCPRLRSLEWLVRRQGDTAVVERPPLTQFTDASLSSLSTLPFFEELKIPPSATACTEKGLLAVVRSNCSTLARRRKLDVLQLDPTGERRSVLLFLDRLLEEDKDLFAGPPLLLTLGTLIHISSEDADHYVSQLARRQVDVTFNRAFVFGPNRPVVMVMISTKNPTRNVSTA